MQIPLVTVSRKWQVVIPRQVREKINLKRGDKVMVFPRGKKQMVVDMVGKSVAEQARGALKKFDTDGQAFKRMLLEKRKELALEDRKIWSQPK